jgi:hypothetical protein
MTLLRGALQVAEHRQDVLSIRASHEPLVERDVVDLAVDAVFTGLARAGETRDPARPGVLGHVEPVALEQRAQGFDMPGFGVADVDEWPLGTEIANDLVVGGPRPVLVIQASRSACCSVLFRTDISLFLSEDLDPAVAGVAPGDA